MAVAACGFFDGVHLGHRKVIDRLCSIARCRGEKSVVVTFWPHPRTVLERNDGTLRLLTTLDEKRGLLSSCGVDEIVVIPFDRQFSQLSTEDFLCSLRDSFGISALVVGYDHRFGHDCKDDRQWICEKVSNCGIEPFQVDEYAPSGLNVSSSAIRKLLLSGQVTSASEMLGYCYYLSGTVVGGNKMGRTIGFPTANIDIPDVSKLVPANGVYRVAVELSGEQFSGICNIGTRPTVSSTGNVTIEVNILDFERDIYGCQLKVSFLGRIRDERRFASLDELKYQLERDREHCRSLIAGGDGRSVGV